MKKNGRVRGTVSRFFSFSTPVRADRNMKSSWLRIVNCKPNEYPFSKKKKRKKKERKKEEKRKEPIGIFAISGQPQDIFRAVRTEFPFVVFVCLFVCLLVVVVVVVFFWGGGKWKAT